MGVVDSEKKTVSCRSLLKDLTLEANGRTKLNSCINRAHMFYAVM